MSNSRRDWIWLIALWVIVTAYNLLKPYHIDDTAHLEIARWIGAHPLHPMRGLLNWSGIDEPIYKLNQPHLYFYLLAFWGSLFGYSEAAMHALQSLPALACIVLLYRLACVLTGPAALWVTAMLVLGPAFIVEQNLMVDVPLLAAWLAFFSPLIRGIGSPSQNRRYALAALACAAALLIKYSSLILVPILCLSLLLERRKGQAWSLLIPLGALAAWSLFNFLDYGGVHIATRPHGVSLSRLRLPKEAAAWVLALGALTPLGLMAAVRKLQKPPSAERAIYCAAFVGFAATLLAVASGVLPDRWSDKLLWTVFLANGILVCLALIPDTLLLARAWSWRPETARALAPAIYLLSWILGTTAFYVMFAPFIAARHVLLILPALTLLLAARWDGLLSRSSKFFGLILTVIVSAGLCLSDWRFASFYKLEAARLAQSLPASGRIWTTGHWGWQWYASRQGFREVDVQSLDLRPGDYLVVPDNLDRQLIEVPPPLRLLRTEIQQRPLLNLICTGRDFRFYTSDYKAAPWSLSRDCVNRLTVFQIESPAALK